MRLPELLRELQLRDIRLYVQDMRLRCKAPRDALTLDLRAAIDAYSDELRELFASTTSDFPKIERADRTQPLPLSFAQQRLWFLAQLDPRAAVYNIPVTLRLTGKLDVRSLERSFDEILRRHEILRTCYSLRDHSPVQHICKDVVMPLPIRDLGELDEAECEKAVRRIALEDSHEPFDLATAPLMRARLLVLPDRSGVPEHILLIVFHHIVTDDWSSALFFRELAAIYTASATGRPAPPPVSRLQYADFAVAQRKWLQGAVLERHLTYWRGKLAGNTPTIALPRRGRRRETPGPGAELTFEIPQSLREGLRRVGRSRRATQFVVMLASFYALLHRYSGRQDISVGTAIANRNRIDVEGMMGFFVNTLVLRADLSGNPRFDELLAQTQTITSQAQSHQDLPFERLVEELRPQARDADQAPLFQIMFVFHNMGFEQLAIPDLQVSAVDGVKRSAVFELVLHIAESGDDLSGWFEYDPAVFASATIERMARNFLVLLEGAAADPDRRLSEMPLLDEAERRILLDEWNAVTALPFGEQLLHRLFERQAVRSPRAIAIVCKGEKVAYGELDAQANRLAHALLEKGVAPETHVGLFIDRGVDMLVGVLGILKAGAAYVPLDPGYPAARIAHMIDDSRIGLIVTREELLTHLPSADIVSLCFDRDRSTIAKQSAAAPRTGGDADCAAYVIYTSGSTGKPKGVVISHANAVHSTRARSLYYPEEPRGFLLLSSFAFDSSIAGLFWTLAEGGTLCIPEPGFEHDPARLGELIVRHGLSHLLCLPSVYRLLLDQAEVARAPSLRAVIVAGEACAPEIVSRHYARLPAVTLYNEYGPTEATVWSTVQRVRPEPIVPIGRPIAGVRIYLLDQWLEPVPIGVDGEVFIGGAGVGRGYLNHAGPTAERFAPDPFSDRGERLYRTGDLARYREDGTIEFLGRVDHQVKIRGFRIELGEIEAVLSALSSVREAVVTACSDERGEMRLVAHLVPTREPEFDEDVSRSELRRSLPDHMIPSAFVRLAALPLSANGKIDRSALPTPDFGARHAQAAYVAPRTSTERRLCDIWASVLGLPHIGVDDDFFELGGHSLLATQAVSRTRAAFGVDLPLRSLFDRPTVAALAPLLDRLRSSSGSAPSPAAREGSLPLSFAQQRLWFLDQLLPGDSAYCIPAAIRLTGRLDTAALEDGLRRLAHRHEILRTTFSDDGDQPAQIVALDFDLSFFQVDLSALAPDEREAEMRRLVEAEAHRPFDLARGPLLRATLLALGEREHVLAVMLHHIVSDGWSTDVLIRDFTAFYTAFRRELPADLPSLPIQYADFSVWQRRRLRDGEFESQIGYWRRKLEGAPLRSKLPTDRARPPIQRHRGATLTFETPAAIANGLRTVGRNAGATLFMVLLAAFKVLLMRHSGQRDICVGTLIANRTCPDVENLIGFFANILVLRTALDGDPTFHELLGRVRETSLEAQENQDVPFEKVVEEVDPPRDPSRNPLVQVLFVLQNAPLRAMELPELTVEALDVRTRAARFDLTLAKVERGSTLVAEWEYDSDLFDAETARRMLTDYSALLEIVAADPGKRLSQLLLPSGAQGHGAEIAEMAPSRPSAPAPHVAPRNPIEQKVANLYKQLLGADEVSVHDDFFEIGGHSLLAATLARRMRDDLGVDVPLMGVFQAPSVARLAELVENLRRGGERPTIARIAPIEAERRESLWSI
ncbi:non-ribosomal peptide synthetase [Methylosinus sp. Ce-a6]|uniref:non-ribosomal peptide synthetase n=1 Tax=Methylosinus sp. Ce-a6 TaxID=2172005 RepID=UPI001356DEA9|nr:non-ribosomal peptide synthetase [Methylosinus sp. Ce-a6]